ncbi:MAG TPA: carbonic anhydrase family protein [Pyrinomonadaceae bacterium]|jgi:carbonic anhydrase
MNRKNFLLVGFLVFAGFVFPLYVTAQKIRKVKNPKSAASGVQTKETQATMTPDMALQRLVEGNKRFVANQEINQPNYRKEIIATAKGQFPFATILSCLDARMSVDDIFDLNNGDAFNARVAGNVVNDDIIGSFEFATKLMNSKLIVVLGHTHCGAVYGACDGVKLGSLTGLMAKIEPAILNTVAKGFPRDSKNDEALDEMTWENVRLSMKEIPAKSPVIKELVDAGKVKIVGAMYHLESGEVKFLRDDWESKPE